MDVPWQLIPSPLNPARQVHSKDPTVSTHDACSLHVCVPVIHCSSSAHERNSTIAHTHTHTHTHTNTHTHTHRYTHIHTRAVENGKLKLNTTAMHKCTHIMEAGHRTRCDHYGINHTTICPKYPVNQSKALIWALHLEHFQRRYNNPMSKLYFRWRTAPPRKAFRRP